MKNGKGEMANENRQMEKGDHLTCAVSRVPFAIPFVLVLLLVALVPRAAVAQARISGRVMNGTTQTPVPNLKVLVLEPRQGMQQVAEVTTDANGDFAVSSDINSGSFYLLQANFDGVPYHAPAQFDASGTARADITVYAAMHQPTSIHIALLRVAIAAQGPKIRVQEQYQIENSRSPPATYANDNGTFSFVVPPSVAEPKVAVQGLMNMTVPLSPEKGKSAGEFKLRYALKPGETPVTVEYEADYANGAFAFSDRAAFPIDRAEMYVVPSSLKVDSEVFKSEGVDSKDDIQKLSAENLKRGAVLAASLSGEAAVENQGQQDNGGQGDVKVVPNTMTRLGVPVLACVLLILLWALGVRLSKEWPRWKERQATSPANKQLEAKTDALFSSMADLDELFAAGKIEKKKYWKERLELKARLMAILKKSPPLTEPYATRRNQP